MGVLIDSTLSWKEHISYISNKLARTIGIMYKIRPFVTIKIMKDIYYALMYSLLVYAIKVWDSACDSHLSKLLILQKQVVRLMTYNDQFPIIPGPLYPSTSLFLKLQIIKVSDIFILQISKFIHKWVNSNISDNFNQWFLFTRDVHAHLTRSNLTIPKWEFLNC